MTSQEKAVAGVVITRTAHSNDHSLKFLAFRRFAKAALVVTALRGWLPFPVAQWLIQHGGLLHV